MGEMTTDNRTNEQLAERLRQFAESQAMDFDSPHVAMTLNEIADRLTATGVAPQPVDVRCDECGDNLDYVAGMVGEGCYPHCWTCWYKEHPQDQIREYKEGQR